MYLIAILSVYVVVCFLTAFLLASTPYREVGLFYNALLAPVYWYAALREFFK